MVGDDSLEKSEGDRESEEREEKENKQGRVEMELNNDQTSLGSMNSTCDTNQAKSQINSILKKTRNRMKMMRGIVITELMFTLLQITIGQAMQGSFTAVFSQYLANHKVIEYASILYEQHCHFQIAMIAQYLDHHSYYRTARYRLPDIYVPQQYQLSYNLTQIILDQFKEF